MSESYREGPPDRVPEPPDERSPEFNDLDERTQQVVLRIAELRQRGASGANWFFWVAGMSVVNSLIVNAGGEITFIVGLGITLLADTGAVLVAQKNPDYANLARGLAIGFALFAGVVVAGFGWLARRPMPIIYALGMFLYLLDGALFVLFQDWLSVGFHAFALYWMWQGLSAFREAIALERGLDESDQE